MHKVTNAMLVRCLIFPLDLPVESSQANSSIAIRTGAVLAAPLRVTRSRCASIQYVLEMNGC